MNKVISEFSYSELSIAVCGVSKYRNRLGEKQDLLFKELVSRAGLKDTQNGRRAFASAIKERLDTIIRADSQNVSESEAEVILANYECAYRIFMEGNLTTAYYVDYDKGTITPCEIRWFSLVRNEICVLPDATSRTLSRPACCEYIFYDEKDAVNCVLARNSQLA